MKIQRSILVLTTVGGLALASPLASRAETSTHSSSTSQDRTASGSFRLSDGTVGTYVDTLTVADNVSTDKVVYTATSASGTSTVTTVTTLNTDGSRLVVYTDLGFGATVPFTSTTTFAACVTASASTGGHGNMTAGSIGTGTYTAADGTAGTLVSLLTRDGQDTILSTDYTSAAGVLTRELRLTSQGPGSLTIRTLSATAANVLTVTTLSRFSDDHHGNH